MPRTLASRRDSRSGSRLCPPSLSSPDIVPRITDGPGLPGRPHRDFRQAAWRLRRWPCAYGARHSSPLSSRETKGHDMRSTPLTLPRRSNSVQRTKVPFFRPDDREAGPIGFAPLQQTVSGTTGVPAAGDQCRCGCWTASVCAPAGSRPCRAVTLVPALGPREGERWESSWSELHRSFCRAVCQRDGSGSASRVEVLAGVRADSSTADSKLSGARRRGGLSKPRTAGRHRMRAILAGRRSAWT